jgi:DNA-binding ferritin-like protein (Dps family)
MTEPSTDRTVSLRKLRHSVQKRCVKAVYAIAGETGLSKADQMIRLDAVIELLETALAKAKAARQLAGERDFDAHLAAKAKAEAEATAKAQAEQQAALAQQAESLPDSAEKASEAQTFEQLINQLAGMPATPPEQKDQPPF